MFLSERVHTLDTLEEVLGVSGTQFGLNFDVLLTQVYFYVILKTAECLSIKGFGVN